MHLGGGGVTFTTGKIGRICLKRTTLFVADSDSYSDSCTSNTITPILFYAGRPVPMWLSEDTDLPNAWGGGDPFPAAGMFADCCQVIGQQSTLCALSFGQIFLLTRGLSAGTLLRHDPTLRQLLHDIQGVVIRRCKIVGEQGGITVSRQGHAHIEQTEFRDVQFGIRSMQQAKVSNKSVLVCICLRI